MAYSVLYSLPGAPVIRSGEEIGMGDDLTLAERLSVRTPMQWNREKNGGFSKATETIKPVISMGEYAYKKINVADESVDTHSLLNHIKKLITVRQSLPEIGTADWQIIDAKNDAVFAIEYQSTKGKVIVLHNFSGKSLEVPLPLNGKEKSLIGKKEVNAQGNLHLAAYGQLWLKR